jgi:hypothetical protein
MMPLAYINDETPREKAELNSYIKRVLRDYHHGMPESAWFDPNNRMKPLDVTKVLMGIQSSRENVKRFSNESSIWAKFQEYDYQDILGVCESAVQQYYVENLPAHTTTAMAGKSYMASK